MSRKSFSREFKVSAVQLVTQQGYKVSAAAKSLGVDPATVRYWLRQLADDPAVKPVGDGAVQVELARLRKENARLVMERDILKKAAAFFAREPM